MQNMKPIKLETEMRPFPGIAQGILSMTDAVKSAVQAALDDVNERATSFTVCYANNVYELSQSAEHYLDSHDIPVSDRGGAKLVYRPVGPSANSYKYGAISTEITLRRRTGSAPIWYLDAVERATVYPRNPARFNVTITDATAIKAVKRTLAAFGRDVVPREVLAPADDAALAGFAA